MSDVGKKKGNRIDVRLLSEKLRCPVVKTVSTSADGLAQLIATAVAQVGKIQAAPYVQTGTLADKAQAEEADRRRFAFVNTIV